MPFRFQRFVVDDSRCAMKVGTDGVLLGAWASAQGKHALDVGTGSGLIALMLTQRNPSLRVHAIDIDPQAAAQAADNFSASPYAQRLTCQLADFRRYAQLECPPLDLVVCNPPFFIGGKGMPTGREMARMQHALPLPTLMQGSARLLGKGGTLAIIIPSTQAPQAIIDAATQGLYLARRLEVRSTPAKPPLRTLLEWQKCPAKELPTPLLHTITLNDDAGRRSKEYTQLTKDFYL